MKKFIAVTLLTLTLTLFGCEIQDDHNDKKCSCEYFNIEQLEEIINETRFVVGMSISIAEFSGKTTDYLDGKLYAYNHIVEEINKLKENNEQR